MRRVLWLALAFASVAGVAAARTHTGWSVLARSPLGPRADPVVVWDGHTLLEFAGRSAAAFDLAQGRWRRLAPAPAGVAVAVWTGRRLFAFGGRGGALFDPVADRWSRARPAPLDPLSQPVAVRDGGVVILAGLALGRLEAARYRPETNTWTRIDPPAPPSHLPQSLSMVTTADGVLLWSLWAGGHGHFPGNGWGVDVYRLGRSGRWANVTGGWPQSQTVNDPVFTGRKVLVAPGQIWCGLCPHPAPFGSHGYSVDPRTLHRTPIPHGPLDDLGPQILWTGSVEISLNAAGEILGPSVRVLPGDIAFWNPRTRRWRRGPRAPRVPSQAPAVWTGHELLVLARDGAVLRYG